MSQPNPPYAHKGSVPPLPKEYISSRSGQIIRPHDPSPPREPVEDRRPESIEISELLSVRARMRSEGWQVRPLHEDVEVGISKMISEYHRLLGDQNGNSEAKEFFQKSKRLFHPSDNPPMDMGPEGPWVGQD